MKINPSSEQSDSYSNPHARGIFPSNRDQNVSQNPNPFLTSYALEKIPRKMERPANPERPDNFQRNPATPKFFEDWSSQALIQDEGEVSSRMVSVLAAPASKTQIGDAQQDKELEEVLSDDLDEDFEEDQPEDILEDNEENKILFETLKDEIKNPTLPEIFRHPSDRPPMERLNLQAFFNQNRRIFAGQPLIDLKELVNRGLKAQCTSFQDSSNFDFSVFPFSDEELTRVLNEKFNFQNFQKEQKNIIKATLSGRDTFVCYPTGAGKSLLYQLPAALENGVTVVISPLISLIQDQMNQLRKWGIKSEFLRAVNDAEALSSPNDKPKIEHIDFEEIDGPVKIIFMTPEKLNRSKEAMVKLEAANSLGRLKRFVIDEAHIVSEWGHSFRPCYLELKKLRELYKDVPIMALTATATDEVIHHVIKKLKMSKNSIVFISELDRSNLFYKVIKNTGKMKEIPIEMLKIIKSEFHEMSGIIYCQSKKKTEVFSRFLNENGVKSTFYHSGRGAQEKNDAQNNWSEEKVKVIVATSAFSMGVHKPNVRFVFHAQFPKTIESFYQESGRAGRDGKPATSILFYRESHRTTQMYFLSKNKSVFSRKSTYLTMNQMVGYCETQGCRKRFLIDYFQREKVECNSSCDNCFSNLSRSERLNILSKSDIRMLLELTRGSVKNDSFSEMATILSEKRGLSIKNSRAALRELIATGVLTTRFDRAMDPKVVWNPKHLCFLLENDQVELRYFALNEINN